MNISVTDPLSRAIARTKFITFQPFSTGKWFSLGFIAFLATLGEGGGSSFNVPSSGGGGGGGTGGAGGAGNTGGSGSGFPRGPASSSTPTPSVSQPNQFFSDITTWISSHWLATALIAAGLVTLVLALSLLVLWVSSRGKFMFIDAIAKNTSQVIEPWKRLRRLGNSLFRFQVCLSAIGFLVLVLIAAVSLLLAWSDIQARSFGGGAIAAIIVGALLLIFSTVGFVLVGFCTSNFVTVIMYAGEKSVIPAWREFRTEIVPGRVGSLFLFLLMCFLLSIGIGIARALLGCVTLCVGFLPYLNCVVALPLLVFIRAYSIYYIQQFGPQYVIITDPPQNFGFPVIMPPPLPTG